VDERKPLPVVLRLERHGIVEVLDHAVVNVDVAPAHVVPAQVEFVSKI